MKQRPRIYYSETQKAMMWDRWQRGETLGAIARLFDRHHSAVGGILSRTGGIRPPPRARSRRALSLAEREEISRGIVAGCSMRSIATSLARGPLKRQPRDQAQRGRPRLPSERCGPRGLEPGAAPQEL